MKGARVQNIVQELRGEKIDIVRWSDNIEELVANALQPVEIARTFADPENEHILVVVPDEQLSLAIGKSGQNIRLTSKLTGWKVDVVRQSEAERVAREQGIDATGDVDQAARDVGQRHPQLRLQPGEQLAGGALILAAAVLIARARGA